MKRSMVVSTKSVVPERSKGVTLIELLITLIVLAIVVAIGAPNMNSLMVNMDIRATSDRLVNLLSYARGEAVANSVDLRVCPANSDNDACSGSNWSNSWIVINPATTAVLRVENNSELGTTVAGVGNPTAVNFNSRGENSGAQIVFTISKAGGTNRSVTVTTAGYSTR